MASQEGEGIFPSTTYYSMILSSQTAVTPSHESMSLSLFCHSDGITHFNKNVVSLS